MSFDYNKVEECFPEAGNLMVEPMKVWKLPDNKQDMYPDITLNGEYFAQEKKDGAWYQFTKTANHSYLFGRTVSTKNGLLTEKSANVPHIVKAFAALPAQTALIGEIFYPGGISKDVTTIMGCLPQKAIERQKNNPIHYYVHDIIYYDGVNLINVAAEKRYKILKAMWFKLGFNNFPFLELAESFDGEIAERADEILAAGGEGIVMKKKNLPYYPGLRPAWSTIKIKRKDSVDLVCMGFCDATKEYTGKELETWPYWEKGEIHSDVCHYEEDGWIPISKPYYYGWKTAMRIGAYDDNGKLVELGTVSSGLTDEDREQMAKNPQNYLGKVFSIDCMQKDNQEKTLRHPHVLEMRVDKPAEDCKISEIFC